MIRTEIKSERYLVTAAQAGDLTAFNELANGAELEYSMNSQDLQATVMMPKMLFKKHC